MDQPRIEIGRHAGRQAAAEHQPRRPFQAAADRLFEPGYLGGAQRGTLFVQLDGQTLPVRDREVGTDLLTHADQRKREVATLQELLEQLPGLAAASGDGERIGAETAQDRRRVDPAASGGLVRGQNVSPVFKDQPVDRNIAVDRGVHCEGDDQTAIVSDATLDA